MGRTGKIEELLLKTDFSRETDLKERLRFRLFGGGLREDGGQTKDQAPAGRGDPFIRLKNEDLTMVTAAGEFVAKRNNVIPGFRPLNSSLEETEPDRS